MISFSHNILFDYAVVLYVLFDPVDPTSLLTTLDADPSLPLIARPSFDLLVDLMWEHSREENFWPLCLAIASSDHVLASLTFAARLLTLISEADDLAPLAPALVREDRPDGWSPRQEVVRQLTGAVRNPTVLPDAAQAGVPLAKLARALATNSTMSFNDAALAIDLLRHTFPVVSEWPVSVMGADGWLQDPDPLLTVDETVETAAQALSTALSSAEPSDAASAVTILVEKLHNSTAWAALMTTENALSLGRVLLPALGSGALLTHPDTHAPASALLSVIAADEPALAKQLEQAVLNAFSLADENHIPSYVKDALVGCLVTDAIASSTLSARLHALGPNGAPKALARPRMTATFQPRSQFGEMRAQGVQLDESTEAARRALAEEIALVNSGNDTRPESDNRLPELFDTADGLFSTLQQLPPILEKLIVEAATALARTHRIHPGTRLGDRVVEVLITAQKYLHVGKLIGSDAWSAVMRDTAIYGLAALFASHEWRDSDSGPPIAETMAAAIHEENPPIRMHAAHVAVPLCADFGTEPTKTAAAVGDLVLAEEHPTVQIALLEQLGKVTVGAETTVDSILERLLDGMVSEPSKKLGRSIMGLLTYLALVPRTSYATRTVEQWCRDAPAHPDEVQAFAQCGRDYLGPSGGEGRTEVYRLLGLAAASSHARWTCDSEEHRATELSEQQRAELQGAIKVTREIAQQIYFTPGGAYDHSQKQGFRPALNTPPSRTSPILY